MSANNVITGTEDDGLFHLSISEASDHSGAIMVDNITDFSITSTSNPASYAIVNSNDQRQFPTSKLSNFSGTYLIERGYDSEMYVWHQNNTRLYIRASLEGNSSGEEYVERCGYVVQFDLNKNGTNVYERPFGFAFDGGSTKGVW